MRVDTVKHEGLRLGLLAAGASAMPAIVLLHGWPHCKEVYAPVVDALATDHFVLAFDLPAIGDSHGAPPSAEKTVLAEIVVSAAERAGAHSMVVAGFDVGGMIAYAAARDHGERIAGAVVMNTVIPGIDPWEKVLSDPRIWHFAFHALPKLPELLVSGHQRAYFDFFTDFLAGNKEVVTEVHRAAFARAYEHPEALKAGFDWYRAFAHDARDNANGAAAPVDVPVLYLRGEKDWGDLATYEAGLRAAGVRRLEAALVPESGHFTPEEQPERVWQKVSAFLAEH